MSCRGELPKLDHAVFADTGWEPPKVYDNLAWLEERAEASGIKVHRVQAGNLKEDALRSQVRGKAEDGNRWASLPYFTGGDNGVGQIKRQCTKEYKIEPIERCIRRNILGLKPRQHAPKEVAVHQWFGISSDESRRMRMSREPWKWNIYPLCNIPIQFLDLPMNRSNCVAWLERNYPGRKFPRSACVGCPFHSNTEWANLKRQPELWNDATQFDEAIRHIGGTRGQVFLHRSCRPLAEAPIEDKNQMEFWDQECLGHCGT
jgi:hypothetical protein